MRIRLLIFFLLSIASQAQTPIKPARPEVQVRKGQYIRDTAQENYGHHDFEGIIILYNHLAQGRATYSAGQVIKLPPIGQIFREAKMDPAYLVLIDELISIATEYQVVQRQYFEVAGKTHLKALQVDANSENIRVPNKPEPTAKAVELEKRLGAVREKFLAGLKKGHATPKSFLGNLEDAQTYLKGVANGMADNDYKDVDMVSQRLGRAFTNALIWTREGYK